MMDSRTFDVGLTTLELENPDHHLLPFIKKGYNFLSVRYLEEALKTIQIKPTPQPKPDEELARMNKELNDLYVKRAKLSNSFHDVVDDASRAAISTDIGHVQSDIAIKIRQIEYYKAHGKTAKTVIAKSKFDIPENDFELFKKLEYLRQSLSRAKKKLADKESAGQDVTRNQTFLKKTEEHYEFIQRIIEEKGLHRKGI